MLEDALRVSGAAQALRALHERMDRSVPSAEFPSIVVRLACNWACAPGVPTIHRTGQTHALKTNLPQLDAGADCSTQQRTYNNIFSQNRILVSSNSNPYHQIHSIALIPVTSSPQFAIGKGKISRLSR